MRMSIAVTMFIGIGIVAGESFGQNMVVLDSADQPVQYMLAPLPGQSEDQMFAPMGSTATFTVDGQTIETRDGQNFNVVNGASVQVAGLADPPSRFNPNRDDVSVEVGFIYLTPRWSNDDFRNLLPGDTPALFQATNLSTRVDHDFTFAPVGEVSYMPAGFDAAFQMSGYFFDVNGKLDQTTGSAAGAGSLTANSGLTVVVANFLEIAGDKQLVDIFPNKFCCKDCAADSHWAQTVVEWSFGGRYSSLNQEFNSTLRQGADVAIASSTQSFYGFGPTGSLAMGHPVGRRIVLFSRTRGSFLVGDNSKTSSFSLTLPNDPAASFANTLSQNRTEVVPVGELEMGLVWNNRDLAEGGPNQVPPGLLWVKAGFVGQIWGNSGHLAAGSESEFRGGSLYLYGFTLQVGLER